MINDYEVPEVIEIGRPQDVILGSTKFPLFPESPAQCFRETEMEDDE